MKRRKWMHIYKATLLATIGLLLVACGTSSEGKQPEQEQRKPEIKEGPEFEKAKEEIENEEQDGQLSVELTTKVLSMYFCVGCEEKAKTEFVKKFSNQHSLIGPCVPSLMGEFDDSRNDEKIESTSAQVVRCAQSIQKLEGKKLEDVLKSPKPFEEGMKQTGGECNGIMKRLEPYKKGN